MSRAVRVHRAGQAAAASEQPIPLPCTWCGRPTGRWMLLPALSDFTGRSLQAVRALHKDQRTGFPTVKVGARVQARACCVEAWMENGGAWPEGRPHPGGGDGR